MKPGSDRSNLPLYTMPICTTYFFLPISGSVTSPCIHKIIPYSAIATSASCILAIEVTPNSDRSQIGRRKMYGREECAHGEGNDKRHG